MTQAQVLAEAYKIATKANDPHVLLQIAIIMRDSQITKLPKGK